MTTFNAALAQMTLRYIRDFPQGFDQMDARRCFGALAARFDGWEWAEPENAGTSMVRRGERMTDSNCVDVLSAAQYSLGLTDAQRADEATDFFNPELTLDDLARMVGELSGKPWSETGMPITEQNQLLREATSGSVPPESGRVEYRCRRCAEVDIYRVADLRRALGSANTYPPHRHTCPNGGIGLMDLIGGTLDPETGPVTR